MERRICEWVGAVRQRLRRAGLGVSRDGHYILIFQVLKEVILHFKGILNNAEMGRNTLVFLSHD